MEYTGDQVVNQLVLKNFTIHFSSGGFDYSCEGFILNWDCNERALSWSEWHHFSSNGICNQQRKLENDEIGSFVLGMEVEALLGPKTESREPSRLCGKQDIFSAG